MTEIAPTRIANDEYQAAAAEALRGSTLTTEHYWSQDVYDAELEHIFMREWICVGRETELPNDGDFITRTIGPEPVVIVRDGNGDIRAHLNVCRHRGCQVVEGRGSTTAFKCPYHGWLYALSGELRGAPEMKETEGFDKADYPLIPLKVEIWHGFIFVNFDLEAEPLAPRIPSLESWVSGYDMGDHVDTREWEFEVNCNWKIYVENFIEEYHVPWVHKDTLNPVMPMKGWKTFPEVTEPWEMMWGEFPNLSWSEEGKALFPEIETLDERNKAGMPLFLVYPTFMCIPAVDCTFYYLAYPEGPEKMRLFLRFAFPRKTAELIKSGDPEAVAKAEEYYAGVDVFIPEDNVVSEKQQRGLRSRRAVPGRLSKRELLVYKVHEYLKRTAYDKMG